MHRLRFWILGKTKRRKPLILLGFQRFLPSDIFDYFALMSDFLKSLENRLPNRHGGSNPSACAKNNSIVDTISAMEFYFLALKPPILMVFRVFFLL